jgi:hypothetical protein
MQGKIGQVKARQSRARRMGHDGTGWCRAGQGFAELFRRDRALHGRDVMENMAWQVMENKSGQGRAR